MDKPLFCSSDLKSVEQRWSLQWEWKPISEFGIEMLQPSEDDIMIRVWGTYHEGLKKRVKQNS